MATNSGVAPHQDPQSGAKTVPLSRPMSPKTPHDRPGFLNSTLHNPNWISRNIFPPTRSIVVGASRMLASVIGFESSSSSSSSSARGSSADGNHDNNDDQDVSSQRVHAIEDHVHIIDTSDDYNYLRGCLSCSFVGHQREPESFAGKNETKCLIEQLLTQESFSRQECDKLTDIIKSRVVDSPSTGGLGIGRLNETSERTGGNNVEIHDFCNTAVLEATKLLEEKSGSNSKSEMHHGTSALNSVTLKHDVEGEAGSPLVMAKSYMQTRSKWASPSKNNIELSPIVMPLFKGKTPYSIGGNFLYSSKRKRDSPATGSWNIHDEIQKVRSKATEEMLRTLSSSKIDRSSFPLEPKSGLDSIVASNLGSAKKDKSQSSKRPVDASRDLAAKPVSQLIQDSLHDLPRLATFGCEQNQVMQTIQSREGGKDETLDIGQRLQLTVDLKTAANSNGVAPDANHLKESKGSILPFSSTKEGTVQDSQVQDKNYWTLNAVAGIGIANGFPSGSNMSSKVDKEQNHRQIISKEDKAGGCGHDNPVRVATVKCELLYDTSMEVPMVNETGAAASGSQRSWSMQYEGSPKHQNTPISKGTLAGKSNSGLEKQQQGKEVSRYYTRNRARNR